MSHTARIFTQEQLTEALASACVQHEMHICTRRAGFHIASLNLRTVARPCTRPACRPSWRTTNERPHPTSPHGARRRGIGQR